MILIPSVPYFMILKKFNFVFFAFDRYSWTKKKNTKVPSLPNSKTLTSMQIHSATSKPISNPSLEALSASLKTCQVTRISEMSLSNWLKSLMKPLRRSMRQVLMWTYSSRLTAMSSRTTLSWLTMMSR